VPSTKSITKPRPQATSSAAVASHALPVATQPLLLSPIIATGSTPLYRLAKSALLRLLESGQFAPGQTLPNETQLASALQVSMGTLRKAVDELVHEHILVRRQGKGTFVALHSNDRFLFQFFHVEPRPDPSDMRAVMPKEYPVVDNVAFTSAKATEDEAYALRLRVGDKVLRIDNRLSLSGKAIVHDRIVVSAQLFNGLTEQRFVQRPSTIYNLYQTDHGITVLRAQERARAAAASPDTARVLGLRAGTPVLEVYRVATTFGDKPVELRISSIDTRQHDYVSVLSQQA
jgi:GntR family transcriptional regulator